MVKKIILKGIKSSIMRKQGPPFVKKIPAIIKTPIDQGERFKYDAAKKAIFMRKPLGGTSLAQESAAKFARGVEAAKLESGLTKVRKAALKVYNPKDFKIKKTGTNFTVKTIKGKQALARIDKAKTQAVKTAQKAGYRALEKRSKELNVGIKKLRTRPVTERRGLSETESKILGWPPSETSAEMKAFYSKGKPSALFKKHRETLKKVRKMPKFVGGKPNIQRQNLISVYKAKAKSELRQAKADARLFRDTTVQKLTYYKKKKVKTYSGKIGTIVKTRTKTIRSPEKKYDTYRKRYYRTKLFD